MSFYNNQFTGTNPFYWWIGQVVDEVNWIGNINPKLHDRDDVPGWGACRCKVRIFGRDTQTKDTPDDQLEMAEVLLPVTAGSGHAGSVQSPNIRQGNYVVGFYKDGIDAREPIIFGVLPNNSQTRLFGGDPKLGFVPRSGYKGKTGQKPVSTKNIYAAGPNSPCEDESCPSGASNRNARDPDQQKDGNRCHYVPKTKACDGPGEEVKGIQKLIKQLLGLINRIKAETNGFLGAASDLTAGISQLVGDFSILISGLFKSLLNRMRGYVVNKLNAGIKDLINFLPPNLRPGLNQVNETATDTLQCVFNKIIRGLVGLVKNLLEDIVDKYVNAPLCAIESFVGNLLSSVLGDITGAIQSAISAVSGVLGTIGDIAGSIFDVFNVVLGVLNFLSCDEPSDCTMGDEWSFWGGAKCATQGASQGIRDLSNKIKEKIQGDAGEAPPCNTAQIPCGPPTIAFAGGGGSGVLGNPIVSATGSILGIDFINGGTGFASPPNISIVDNCGIGGGAVIVPIIDTSDTSLNPGQTTVNDDTITTVGGETIITGGTTTISDGNISSSGGTVVSTGGNTVATTTDGNTTANGGNIAVTGGTSTTLDGVQTITGGIITITGGSVTTTGGSTTTSGTSGSVVTAVVVDPGSGYLSSQNGSTGGNGSVFSKVDDTIVFNEQNGYNVYGPNNTISVLPGDVIYAPPGSIIDVYDQNGNVNQTITGQGGTTPITVETGGNMTTPTYEPSQAQNAIDPSSKGSYPVVLSIGDVAILNGGVNYNPTDKIVISPDNGAELEPTFNDAGKLVDVKVLSPGIGFTEFPNLFIESEVGINAVIVPVFNILRVGDLPEDQDIVPPGTQIISVVDCVGKVD